MAQRLLNPTEAATAFRMSSQPYDEMRTLDGGVRSHYLPFADWLDRTSPDRTAQNRGEAERAFHRVGITFAGYGDGASTERLIPFDLVPRMLPGDGWQTLDVGLQHHVRA